MSFWRVFVWKWIQIAWLEFDLADYNLTVQHFTHYAKGTKPPPRVLDLVSKKKKKKKKERKYDLSWNWTWSNFIISIFINFL